MYKYFIFIVKELCIFKNSVHMKKKLNIDISVYLIDPAGGIEILI